MESPVSMDISCAVILAWYDANILQRGGAGSVEQDTTNQKEVMWFSTANVDSYEDVYLPG